MELNPPVSVCRALQFLLFQVADWEPRPQHHPADVSGVKAQGLGSLFVLSSRVSPSKVIASFFISLRC